MIGLMKTKNDPRHLGRVHLMQAIFAWEFKKERLEVIGDSEAASADSSSEPKLVDVLKNMEKIDAAIKEAAPAWPIEKINKLDLAILRLASYELLVDTKTPIKVVVDEAVELGKEYGSESSASFINGALGKLIHNLKIKT